MLDPGLEIDGLFDQRRRHLRIRRCLGEFEKDGCLTLYILPADHFFIPGCLPRVDMRKAGKSFQGNVTK